MCRSVFQRSRPDTTFPRHFCVLPVCKAHVVERTSPGLRFFGLDLNDSGFWDSECCLHFVFTVCGLCAIQRVQVFPVSSSFLALSCNECSVVRGFQQATMCLGSIHYFKKIIILLNFSGYAEKICPRGRRWVSISRIFYRPTLSSV